ncbi:MAG: nucleoside:proton symporter [SAR324 cluster bacterium]|nr:nucleoside:proton symporter [SAR324 cluster bacterium]
MMFQGLLGIIALMALSWGISENRKSVNWKTVGAGLMIQLLLALILLKIPLIKEGFMGINQVVLALEKAMTAGTAMVFGYLGGGEAPFDIKNPGATFILAFRALPLVLMVSALSSLLFYWKILPYVIRGFSWGLRRTMGVGGAVGVSAAANIFVGMVEAPLFIRPYIQHLTRSELFVVMTTGMATVAGTVMALYAFLLGTVIPDALGHILVASIISAPAAILVAQLMIPSTTSSTEGEWTPSSDAASSMDAITKGTEDGLKLFLNILAMLIVLVALVHLVNQILGLLPLIQGEGLTLQKMLGWVMAPVMWLIGIPWDQAFTAGSLMGTKTILNELIAYIDLSQLPADALDVKSRLIMLYAMCGFANFGSLGIMIAGLTTMAPERRNEIVSLGMKSILSGTIATCMTGAVVGIIY